MAERKPTLVFIFGPPAVGKMTVGQELARMTSFPLFHNHQIIDVLTNFFDYGSPAFTRLYRSYRDTFFREAAESRLGLVTTAGWRLDLPGDTAAVRRDVRPFLRSGGQVFFVELAAPLETRLARNHTENRRLNKKTDWATDDELRRLDAAHRYNTSGAFPLKQPHHLIETAEVTAEQAARRILDHFSLSQGSRNMLRAKKTR